MTKTPKRPKPAYGEPWKAAINTKTEAVYLQDAAELRLTSDYHDVLSPKNAYRIAACVNFCRQFPTHWLETRQLHYAHPNTPLIDVPNQDGLVIVTRNDDQNTTREHQNHA